VVKKTKFIKYWFYHSQLQNFLIAPRSFSDGSCSTKTRYESAYVTVVSHIVRWNFLAAARGVKRQWGCRKRQFWAFSPPAFSQTLEMRPALLYSPSSVFRWFQNAWPWMTLNGYFALNSVFAPVWLAPTAGLSKNNCVKSDNDRHILSATQILGKDASFWKYKVCADIVINSKKSFCVRIGQCYDVKCASIIIY